MPTCRGLIPEHRAANAPAIALSMGGALAIRSTGILGAWAKTYYPESVIAAVDRMWQLYSERSVNWEAQLAI